MTYTLRLPGQPCPSCGRTELLLEEAVEKDEVFGDLLLSVIRCEFCGHRNSDVIFLRNREPISVRIKIRSLEDLKSRVARSSSAIIRLPELGVKITPRNSADGFVSNVEGVLERVETVLETIIPTLRGKRQKRATVVLKNLRRARNGEKRFTMELKDPTGNSAITAVDPHQIKERRLTKREIEALTRHR